MKELFECQYCRVKFEKLYAVCPVCECDQKTGKKTVLDSIEEKAIKWGWKNLFFNISFFMMLIPAFVNLTIDYILNGTLTWSIGVVVSIFFGWLYLVLLIKYILRPILLGIIFLCLTVAFLYVLDYLDEANWIVSFGLPLALGIPLLSMGIIFIIKKNRNNFLKIISYFILGATLICVYIEGVYAVNKYHRVVLTWSLIVLGATIPLILVLQYLARHKKIIERWIHY